MKKLTTVDDTLTAWKRIPRSIRNSIHDLSESELDLEGGSDGWTIRENVHHLVEANLVAANMIIAALATEGGYFDWTWVNPKKSWMRCVGYVPPELNPQSRCCGR